VKTLVFVVLASLALSAQDQPRPQHNFFDSENKKLFLSVAAARSFDCISTWHARANGGSEVLLTNSLVDNKPAFAAFSAAMVGANVAAAALLHRTGHHRSERVLSYVHASAVGVTDFHNFRVH
jgi:hypothetical protein